MRSLFAISLAVLLFGSPVLAQAVPAAPITIDEAVLAKITPHPRLLLNADRLAELKALAAKDATLQKAVDDLLKLADLYVPKEPLKDGNDWNTWREVSGRVFALGFAYRWTGDDKYVKPLRETLLACAGFNDWHERIGFLDTGEMTANVAIGYDWLYDKLSAEDRKTIQDAIMAKGLAKGLDCYTHKDPVFWWTTCENNWNLACNSGMAEGAMAVAEVDPPMAIKVLNAAAESLQHVWPTYEPDGGWMEGPYYWEYASRLGIMGLASGESALGEAGLKLLGSHTNGPIGPGLAKTWQFGLYVTNPDGVTMMPFADSTEHHWHLPFIYYLAGKANDQVGIASEFAHFDKPHPYWPTLDKEVTDPRHAVNRALDIIWYHPATAEGIAQLAAMPLAAHLHSKRVELASFRTAWNDPNAMGLIIKAGDNGGTVDHAHCDAGNFELTSQKVIWTVDPGRGEYGTKGYFDHGTAHNPGTRWQVPRVGSIGHSVLRINDQTQAPWSVSPITRFEAIKDQGFAIIDTSQAYPQAKKASRGFWFAGGQYVLVQDELDMPVAATVTWQLVTPGKVAVTDDGATIDRWGVKMRVKVLEPAAAKFTIGEAVKTLPNRLVMDLPNMQGAVRIAVLLVPPTDPAVKMVEKLPDVKVQPQEQWKLPAAP